MEIDSPKTKAIHCDLSCLIKRLPVVPVKRKLKKTNSKEILYRNHVFCLQKFERQLQCLAFLRYFFNKSLYQISIHDNDQLC